MVIGEAPCGHAKTIQQRRVGYQIERSLSRFFLQEFPRFLSVRRETEHTAPGGADIAPHVGDPRPASNKLGFFTWQPQRIPGHRRERRGGRRQSINF